MLKYGYIVIDSRMIGTRSIVLGICDFSSVMQTIKEYISDSRELSQTDLLYEVFATFIRVNSSWKGGAYEVQDCRLR